MFPIVPSSFPGESTAVASAHRSWRFLSAQLRGSALRALLQGLRQQPGERRRCEATVTGEDPKRAPGGVLSRRPGARKKGRFTLAKMWLWINTYENTMFIGMNIHKSQLF